MNVSSKYLPNKECTVIASIKYSSGDEGLYFGLWNGIMGGWTLEVNTEECRWKAEPLESAFFMPKGERIWKDILKSQDDIDFKAGLLLQAREMVQYCQTGKRPIIPNLAEIERTYILINKIFQL